MRVSPRLHRGHRRLDHDRGRAAALDDLRPVAHCGFGDAVADRRGCADLPRALHAGLSGDLSHRPLLHGPDRPRRTGAGRREPAHRERKAPRPGESLVCAGGCVMPSLDLTMIWTAILAVSVFFYVVLDGFDLGVGILYGFIS